MDLVIPTLCLLLSAPPPIIHALPNHKTCNANYYRAQDLCWEAQRQWHECHSLNHFVGIEHFGRAVDEQRHIQAVWNLAWYAANDQLPWPVRLRFLNDLGELVGWRAVMTGLPGPGGQWIPEVR